MQKILETEESAGPGGLLWITELSLTVQDKQGTHEQPSQNSRGSSTQSIKNQGFTNFWLGLFE